MKGAEEHSSIRRGFALRLSLWFRLAKRRDAGLSPPCCRQVPKDATRRQSRLHRPKGGRALRGGSGERADEVETIATANAKLSEYRRGRRQDWRRNSGSLEHSGKDLSRGLASLRSVKRIACVEPLTIQRDSGRTNILQTFKKRYLADRSGQAATPVSSSTPITTGCCGPGHLIQQRFGSILRMIAALPLPNG